MSEKLESSVRRYFVQRGYQALREHQFPIEGPEIHIGVIGPYQAGKSTLINTVFNAAYPVAFTGNPADNHREGVTQKIHVFGFKDKLFVYDTPGFWDATLENQTRVFLGIEQNPDYLPFDSYALCKTGTECCPVAERTLRSRSAGVADNARWTAESVAARDGLRDFRDRRTYGKLAHVHTGSLADREGVIVPIGQCRSLNDKGNRYEPGGQPCARLEEASIRPKLTMMFVVVDIGDRVASQQISSAKSIARTIKEQYGTPTFFLLNRGIQYQPLTAQQQLLAERQALDTMRGEFPTFLLSVKAPDGADRVDTDHEELIALIAEVAFADEGKRFRTDLRRDFHAQRQQELDREILARSVQAAQLARKGGARMLAHFVESADLIVSRAMVPFTPVAPLAGEMEHVLRAAELLAPDGPDIWSHAAPPEPGSAPKATYPYGDLWPKAMLDAQGSLEKMSRALKPQSGYPAFLANLAWSVWTYNHVVRAERAANAAHEPGEPQAERRPDLAGGAVDELRATASALAHVYGALAPVLGTGSVGRKSAEVMPIYEQAGLLRKYGEAFGPN